MPVTRARTFRVAILALALFIAGRAHAAPADSPDFLIDLWTSDDDLPDSSVTAIAQTPDRYLWIGTLNGLARFDGLRFVHFDPLNTPELKHARVNRLFVDDHGTLWINTYGGAMTALRDGVFTHEWDGGEVSAVFSRSNGGSARFEVREHEHHLRRAVGGACGYLLKAIRGASIADSQCGLERVSSADR